MNRRRRALHVNYAILLAQTVVLFGLILCTSPKAQATWSIVAVDAHTREVGAAGASCTPNAIGIAGLAPGHGVMVAQALSNSIARKRGVQLLMGGATPPAIIQAITAPGFDTTASLQQYGVVALDHANAEATFTGKNVDPAATTLQWPGVTVQGNVLPSTRVVHSAMAAFKSASAETGLPLAEKLLSALQAGAAQGGDRRCGEQTAHSAFLIVARPGDPSNEPFLRLIVLDETRTGENPVRLLLQFYDGQQRFRPSFLRANSLNLAPKRTLQPYPPKSAQSNELLR